MTGQLSSADLAAMAPEQIEQARIEGRLDDLLGRRRPFDETRLRQLVGQAGGTDGDEDARGDGQLSAADLAAMVPEEIDRAREVGLVDRLLGRE